MYRTEQEEFWTGKFGDEYVDRNNSESSLPAYRQVWSEILAHTGPLNSAIEYGANIGLNLIAMHDLQPHAHLECVEINTKAVEVLKTMDWVSQVHAGSLLEWRPQRKYNLAFTRGVLIHINPKSLPVCYDLLYRSSDQYILIDEYYNPTPVTVRYRGNEEKLFKRDFAGEMMDRFPDLELVNYGFTYHRDPSYPLDDTTWFLLRKTGKA